MKHNELFEIMNSMTVSELMDKLKQGDDTANDILYELTKADAETIWDYVPKVDIEYYLEDSGIQDITTQEIFDFMKDEYELVDANAEISNAVEIYTTTKES